MATKLLEVRPIESKKWHGKIGKESFARPKKIQALADAKTMQYAVSFTEEDLKFLEEKKVSYDLSLNFDSEKPHPFWDSGMAAIKLENHTMFFDKNVPLERIKIAILRGSRFVANSMAEYEEGLYPDATHVIHDEVEQAEIKASKVEQKNRAVIIASKLPRERKIQIILAMGGRNMKNQSDDFIIVELDELISKDPEKFIRVAERDKKSLADFALVIEALQKNVLRKEGHKILYMDSVLGSDEDAVAEYLGKDENQDLKMIIIQKVS